MKITKFLNIDIEPAPPEMELEVEKECREIMKASDLDNIKRVNDNQFWDEKDGKFILYERKSYKDKTVNEKIGVANKRDKNAIQRILWSASGVNTGDRIGGRRVVERFENTDPSLLDDPTGYIKNLLNPNKPKSTNPQ